MSNLVVGINGANGIFICVIIYYLSNQTDKFRQELFDFDWRLKSLVPELKVMLEDRLKYLEERERLATDLIINLTQKVLALEQKPATSLLERAGIKKQKGPVSRPRK